MDKKQTVALLVVIFVVGVALAWSFLKKDGNNEVNQVLSESRAIELAVAKYPELAAYQTTSLPPSSIDSKESENGWYLGFIQSGSGVPGILHAKCYEVTGDKRIIVTGEYSKEGEKTVKSIQLETCAPIFVDINVPPTTSSPTTTTLPYGYVTLKLNQTATFKNISIRPLSVEEDSRCAEDVQCIWAGTVRLKIEIIKGGIKNTSVLNLNEAFLTDGEIISLKDVKPYPNSKITINKNDYSFVINVAPKPVSTTPISSGKCYVGGCSAQICSDQPDMVSTCEYRAEYACYKTAVCKRQQNGKCGWTQTPELSACLANTQNGQI